MRTLIIVAALLASACIPIPVASTATTTPREETQARQEALEDSTTNALLATIVSSGNPAAAIDASTNVVPGVATAQDLRWQDLARGHIARLGGPAPGTPASRAMYIRQSRRPAKFYAILDDNVPIALSNKNVTCNAGQWVSVASFNEEFTYTTINPQTPHTFTVIGYDFGESGCLVEVERAVGSVSQGGRYGGGELKTGNFFSSSFLMPAGK